MRKFASAMLIGLLLATISAAQTKTYEVKSGDTISAIATRHGVSQKDLIRANGLTNSHKLKLGQKLRIPAASRSAAAAPKQSGGYVVRNGDNDWSIAKRYGITSAQLRAMNPGVNWRNLKLGSRLNVPGSKVATARPTSSSARAATVSVSNRTYKVRQGDNDWRIASRVGTTPAKLRAANPGVRWDRLQIGQTLRVPGTGASAPATAQTAAIRSRYAVIAKDNVILRRTPSTTGAKVTTVSAGTPVQVVSRKGDWYQLKFPRGTVAWVRGDMLKATTQRPASTLASVRRPSNSTSRPSTRVATNTRSKSSLSGGNYVAKGGSGSKAVDHAMSMMGTRYRYGGASRSGTDCSGLVIQAYRAQGVNLPRTSASMATVGKAVPKGELKPGDLVFFRTRGSRISHVGIYKGGGKFVHSSSGRGRVTVNSLSDGYYSRRYAGARRVVKSTGSKTSTPKAATTKAPVAKKETATPEPKSTPANNPTEIVP